MQNYKINVICDTHFTNRIPSSRKDNYPLSIKKKYVLIPLLYQANLHIIAGDIFHRPTLPLAYINSIARMERNLQKKFGHSTYVIVGNHDVSYHNMLYLKDSALGNFLAHGSINLLDEYKVYFHEYNKYINIYGLNFGIKELPEIEKNKDHCNILIAHTFFEPSAPKRDAYQLYLDQIRNNNFDIIVLGHDHYKYKPVKIYDSIIYRPGSLSRGTATTCNMFREVSILQLDFNIDKEKIDFSNSEYKTIPSISPELAFKNEARIGSNRNIKLGIDSFVDTILSSEIHNKEIIDVLKEMNIEKDIFEYVNSLLVSYGVIMESNATIR